jgi:succinate dehydrogenase flavin-adding protein (antitoxin of CptAB toxin-antitoxin module)
MLPAFIQYGVRTPEAALASLLSVPRQFAEAVGAEYRERHGTLSPEEAGVFKKFIEDADAQLWSAIVARSPMADQIDPSDVRAVWRQIQGIAR